MNAPAKPIPIIDTHIHLFDPRRPQGVPWPPKGDSVLYHAASLNRYREVTKDLGVVGVIEVECSPWLEDNQWVLDVAAKDPIVVGIVGNLEPEKPDFQKHLERFHGDPLFLGIRCGNLWGRNLGQQLANPDFVSGLKALADVGLELDMANPDPALLQAVVRLTDRVPHLRIVIDHLPQLKPDDRRAANASLQELGRRSQVLVKLSEVLRRVNDEVPLHVDFYRVWLDEIFGIFGEDRLLYGSDWPNSDRWGSYPEVLRIVREYFTNKRPHVMEKFFWKNSISAYRWIKRDASQPSTSLF
ncbi:MAG: amidohydrolase family protein [Terriglobia bacterium]